LKCDLPLQLAGLPKLGAPQPLLRQRIIRRELERVAKGLFGAGIIATAQAFVPALIEFLYLRARGRIKNILQLLRWYLLHFL